MGKIRPVIDVEASEKNTIKNSPIGQWAMSDKKCPHCGTPALPTWNGACIKCGKDLNTPPTPPPAPVAPAAPAAPENPKKKVVPKPAKAKAAEAEPEPEADEETEAAEPEKKYECKKCGTEVTIDDDKCPKCGGTEAVEVE